MPNVFVNVIEPGDKRGKSIVADQKGRFRFVRLQNKPYDVTVQVWDPPKGAPPIEARDVWPDRGLLELVAAYDAPVKLATATVTGVVVDAAARAASPAAIRVVLVNDGKSWNPRPTVEDGRFTFKDVEPGKKQLLVLTNTTGGSLTCTIDGASGTTVNFPGAPGISVAAGYAVVVGAGLSRSVVLSTISAYTQGVVHLLGAATLTAQLFDI
jgi:hypothetical protein